MYDINDIKNSDIIDVIFMSRFGALGHMELPSKASPSLVFSRFFYEHEDPTFSTPSDMDEVKSDRKNIVGLESDCFIKTIIFETTEKNEVCGYQISELSENNYAGEIFLKQKFFLLTYSNEVFSGPGFIDSVETKLVQISNTLDDTFIIKDSNYE